MKMSLPSFMTQPKGNSNLTPRILKSLVSHVLNLKSWIKMIFDKITYTYCVTNEFDQLLRFKTRETRLFKMPRLKPPRLVTGTRIEVASEHCWIRDPRVRIYIPLVIVASSTVGSHLSELEMLFGFGIYHTSFLKFISLTTY